MCYHGATNPNVISDDQLTKSFCQNTQKRRNTVVGEKWFRDLFLREESASFIGLGSGPMEQNNIIIL